METHIGLLSPTDNNVLSHIHTSPAGAATAVNAAAPAVTTAAAATAGGAAATAAVASFTSEECLSDSCLHCYCCFVLIARGNLFIL